MLQLRLRRPLRSRPWSSLHHSFGEVRMSPSHFVHVLSLTTPHLPVSCRRPTRVDASEWFLAAWSWVYPRYACTCGLWYALCWNRCPVPYGQTSLGDRPWSKGCVISRAGTFPGRPGCTLLLYAMLLTPSCLIVICIFPDRFEALMLYQPIVAVIELTNAGSPWPHIVFL